MFEQGGLSLDQAPPVSVVFRFFLIGAFFGILAGIFILYYGDDIQDTSSTAALVITHLLSLGVMMSFMLGALFQMLPVIAGVTIESPLPKSNLIRILLAVGTITLITGFIYGFPSLFILSSVLLGGSLLYVSLVMGINLIKVKNHTASSRGMMWALASLLVVVLLALYMTGTYAQVFDGVFFAEVKQAHYSAALFGWIALLIVSISFQTIEMFYVTPAYPKLTTRWMPMLLVVLIFVGTLFSMLKLQGIWNIVDILIAVVLMYYAGLTLLRLSQRKRPLADATLWFWRVGLGSLMLGMFIMILNNFLDYTVLSQAVVVLFASFALSIVLAMFYKIVPFLTWFHLNAQGYFTAPMMHEVIHPKTAKKHLWMHIGMVILFLLAIVLPILIYLAGILMIVSFAWVGYQVLHANKLYKHTQDTGERFDMNMGYMLVR